MDKKQAIDVGTCPVNASHETTACVPISICPFTEPGPVTVENCGAPVVNCSGEPCCGTLGGSFEFTVSQRMRINIPLIFGADVAVGEAYVRSGQTTGCINGECTTCSCSDCGCDDGDDDDSEK